MARSTKLFVVSGLLALAAATTLHLLLALGWDQAWAALVHITLFGWISGLIFAINYHTMPVFAARDFPWPRLIWLHWAVFSGGITVAALGLLTSWRWLTLLGLGLELTSSLLFMLNTLSLFLRGVPRGARMPAPPAQRAVDRLATTATKAAGLCLPLALAVLLAQRLGWLGAQWWLAAEHLTTLGWVLLMIVGVACHVLPRWTGVALRGATWLRWQLRTHLAALLLMVLALGLGWSALFAVGGVLMAVALTLFGWLIWPPLRQRDPLRLADLSVRCVLAAFAFLALGIGLGVTFAFNRATGALLRPLHAEANLWGFVSLFIYGMAYHMLPRFMGRRLPWPALAAAQSWLAIGGVALALYGWCAWAYAWPGSRVTLVAGCALQTLAAALFALIAARTLRPAHVAIALSALAPRRS